MITKNDWCTFTVYDYLVLLSLTHHINIESNNQNLTKEIWLFSGFRPFPSIILKYGILSWLMKEKRTFVNGNCIGSWATYSSIHFHGHSPNPQGQLRWRLTNALRNELLEKRIYVCNNWGKGMILNDNNVVSYDLKLCHGSSSRNYVTFMNFVFW